MKTLSLQCLDQDTMPHWRQGRKNNLLCENNLSRFVVSANHVNFEMKPREQVVKVQCDCPHRDLFPWWHAHDKVILIDEEQIGCIQTQSAITTSRRNSSHLGQTWSEEVMPVEEHKELNDWFFSMSMWHVLKAMTVRSPICWIYSIKKSWKSPNNLVEHLLQVQHDLLQVVALACHLETNAPLCLDCHCGYNKTGCCKQDKEASQTAMAVKSLNGEQHALRLRFCAAFELIQRLTSVI